MIDYVVVFKTGPLGFCIDRVCSAPDPLTAKLDTQRVYGQIYKFGRVVEVKELNGRICSVRNWPFSPHLQIPNVTFGVN